MLKLRRIQEEEAKRQLGLATARLEKERAVLAEMRETLRAAVGARGAERADGDFDAVGQMLFLEWCGGEKARMGEQMQKIAAEERAVEEKRQVLLGFRRAVRILEVLRERRYRQWRLEENRRQNNVLSDLAGQMWLRENAARE